MTIKNGIIKYSLVLTIVGILTLRMRGIIASNMYYFLSGAVFLLCSFLVLVKKYYFLSNVAMKGTSNYQKIGKISGIVALIIGLVFILFGIIE